MAERPRRAWYRRLRRLTGSLTIVVLAISACGVPGDSQPIKDPNLPSTTSQSVSGGQPPVINPDSNFYPDESAFVTAGYMNAVLDQISEKLQIAAARAFMTKSFRWLPPPNSSQATALPVTVVRPVGVPVKKFAKDGSTTVTLDVDIVGTYDPILGKVTGPSNGPKSTELTFSVVTPPGGSGFRLSAAPNGLYMFASALYDTHNYAPQSIYYWTADGHLVPDLRYVPTWQSPRQQVTSIVNWILQPPTAWGGSLKQPVPDGVGLRDPTVTVDKTNNAFVINLTPTTMTAGQEDDFLVQVRWSLGQINIDPHNPGGPQLIELQIANRLVMRDVDPNYIDRNQSTFRDKSPTAYAVVGGKVAAIGYVLSGNGAIKLYDKAESLAQPKAFTAPENENVLFGAVRVTPSASTDVAIVKENGGKPELWVNRTNEIDAGKFVRVKMGFTVSSFSRPVWLTQLPGALAVIADGKLYIVSGPKNTVVPVATNVSDMTAFDIGQDGYRIAYVAGGQVYVALLTASGDPAMTPVPMMINVRPDVDKVDAVAWSDIYQLVVAGTYGPSGKGYSIETNVDGIDDGWLTVFTVPQTPQIVSYPPSPLDVSFSAVMLQQPDGAYSGRANLSALWVGKGPVANNPFFGE